MSGLAFILASIPAGLAVVGVLWLIGKLTDALFGPEVYSRRLRRRRELLMAGDVDHHRYELGEIEARLADNAERMARPYSTFPVWPHPLVMPFMVVAFGAIAAYSLVEPLGLGTPPTWARAIGWSWMPLFGISYLIDPARAGWGPGWPGRILGIFFIALGVWMLSESFSALSLPSN